MSAGPPRPTAVRAPLGRNRPPRSPHLDHPSRSIGHPGFVPLAITSVRRVPIHRELVRCGLLEYLKALPPGQLFPGLKPGGPDGKLSWYFTRRYTDFRRSVGIDRPRVSFHSFRKNVTTALDNAGVPNADIAALIGHERGFTLDVYSKGLEPKRLRGIVEKVKYPGLNLKHLHVE